MDIFLQDVRYGLRTLARQPGFAATAILTLALGIGATTAIFSVVNAVVLRPLPFDEPDRIVALTNLYTRLGTTGATVSGPDVLDWRDQSHSFETLAHYRAFETSVTVANASDYAMVVRVSPGYFAVFGTGARLGRLLTDEEATPEGPPAVVISDAYWRRQFAADPAAIGATLTLDQRTYTVVGVTAPGFRFPARADIYAPEPGHLATASRSAHNYRAVGRLAAGVRRWRRPPARCRPSPRASAPPIHKATATRACGSPRSRTPSSARHVRRSSSCSAPSASCCSSPAPTSPTCCSPAPRPAAARSPCARRSAPGAAGWCASCSPRAWCWRSSPASAGR